MRKEEGGSKSEKYGGVKRREEIRSERMWKKAEKRTHRLAPARTALK